ncbi:MAG: hypothetical protein PVI53_12570 [Desulfobacteraceae bacterium]|jgi:hypothetical protein
MTNVKAQSSNECQSPNAKAELQRKIFDIESLGFDLSFGFCHLTFPSAPREPQSEMRSQRGVMTSLFALIRLILK